MAPDSILSLLVLMLVSIGWVAGKQEPRSIQIMNSSNRRVELYWIHPDTKEMVLQSNPVIYHGATFSLNSFVSHSFEIREMAASKTGMCGDDGEETNDCRKGYFTVNTNDDQVIIVHPGFVVEHTDNKSVARKRALEVMGECQAKALSALRSGSDEASMVSPQQSQDAIQDLVHCVEGRVANAMEKVEEEISFETTLRHDMALLLEGYTCDDDKLNTTEAKSSASFRTQGGSTFKVHTLHDRPSSKVHYLDKFLTERECTALSQAAAPQLARGHTRDGTLLAESATVELESVKRKVYDYVNSALDLEDTDALSPQGQEPFRFVKFHAVSEESDDAEPDQYKPHCDGPCQGNSGQADLRDGTIVATMILYCSVPTKGGATNFRNSGLHIVPEFRGATFMASADIINQRVDHNGFTEYSMCPVREGEETAILAWIRYGVNQQETWDSLE